MHPYVGLARYMYAHTNQYGTIDLTLPSTKYTIHSIMQVVLEHYLLAKANMFPSASYISFLQGGKGQKFQAVLRC